LAHRLLQPIERSHQFDTFLLSS